MAKYINNCLVLSKIGRPLTILKREANHFCIFDLGRKMTNGRVLFLVSSNHTDVNTMQ